MHHCHVVNIHGNSYRMREHTDLWQALQPGYEEPPSKSSRQAKKKETKTH
ncbi:MAG: hypothetical protein ACE5FV_14010 [Woeseia sp.]